LLDIPLEDLGRKEGSRVSRPRAGTPGSQLDITALPSMTASNDKLSPAHHQRNRVATELYTVSYLIFFAILGTLARLGLQALTFYPGAPVAFSELWANVGGTFIIGFLSEDRRLFHAEWGRNEGPDDEERVPEPVDRPAEYHAKEKKRHAKVKKTIPLYIGLATGFCGSFTSYSSFMRDVFLALSSDLPTPLSHPHAPGTLSTSTVPRNRGYSVLALLAIILTTLALCSSALKAGAHLAASLSRVTPILPFRLTRRFLDPLIVFLGWGCWIGAILLTILPPTAHPKWRTQVLFALVFAPPGCLARYYISVLLNPIAPTFPLGTFTANIFGTAVLGMAYDLQRVRFAGASVIGCQVLQGIQDGFCGCLTTVSTWVLELDGLKRRQAYVYGVASVGVGVGLLVAVMGGVRWSAGWDRVLC
jgi:CrcB protein